MSEFGYDLPPLKYDETDPGSRDWAILEWCEDRLKAGQRFVESSIGYDRISQSLDAVFMNERETGASYAPVPKKLSNTRVNLVGDIAEELTAQLTDTRVFWNYGTNNPRYEKQARLANKSAEDWYTGRLIDLRLADMIRLYSIAGSSYAHLYYSRRLNDQMVEVLDPRHVFPIEPISYHTLQDALGVIIRKTRTPNWVKSEYGKTVKADIGAPGVFGWFTRTFGGAKGRKSGPLSKRSGDDEGIPATPTVFVNTMYLKDSRVNETKKTVRMGKWTDDKPATRWSYEVTPGSPLYPFGRFIAWTSGCLLEDGPSPYWHAMFPLIKLTLNPWPGAWLGKAPIWDILPLQLSENALLRVIDDHAAQVAQPGVVADRNVARSELNKFDSRAPGFKIRTNLASGKGIQIQPPPPLDQSLWEHVNWIEDRAHKSAGTLASSAAQMAQLAQIPSDDTIDTLMKAMTPRVRLRSRILEGFMVEFAQMYLYNLAEFDTLTKRMAKFGPTAITPEDFDYSPGSFIPDDVPDGEPGDVASTENAFGEGPRPVYERAKQMLESFSYKFKKGSLLNSAATQERMEDLILSKMGYLSWFTLMENLGRMNTVPPELNLPSSELERLQLQQQLGIGMVANAQGRKATDQAPPQMQANSSGEPTITTS